MRTFTLIGAALLLAACRQSPQPTSSTQQNPPSGPFAPIRKLGNPNDSSPIIISDGSIHITNAKGGIDHFRVHSSQHASVKVGAHQPYYIGYQCSYSAMAAGSCTTACSAGSVTSPCYIAAGPAVATNWTLTLCESASCTGSGNVQLTWQVANPNDSEKLDITSNDGVDFEVVGPTGTTGTDLHHKGASSLQSAVLSLTDSAGSHSYSFTCQATPPGQPRKTCFTLSYECHVSGNESCGN